MKRKVSPIQHRSLFSKSYYRFIEELVKAAAKLDNAKVKKDTAVKTAVIKKVENENPERSFQQWKDTHSPIPGESSESLLKKYEELREFYVLKLDGREVNSETRLVA